MSRFAPERLYRRTSTGRFISEIDGLRFAAIALVVVYHVNGFVSADGHRGALWHVADGGGHGVEVFFVISGFILGLPFAVHHLTKRTPRPSTKAYFWRRLTRLEPPYIIAMVGCAVVLVGVNHAHLNDTLHHLGASLIYQHGLIYDRLSTINAVAWSLEVEVQFYILAPLLAFVFVLPQRQRRAVLIGGSAVIVIARAAIFDGGRVDHTLLNFVEYFAAGFLLADIYITRWDQAPKADSRRWDLAGIAAWVVLLVVWHERAATELCAAGLILVAFVAAFRGPRLNSLVRNRWLVAIGGMCYSIYLLHYPLISQFGKVTNRLPSMPADLELLVHGAILIPLVLAVSTVFFLLVERPCMDPHWPEKLRQRVRRTELSHS